MWRNFDVVFRYDCRDPAFTDDSTFSTSYILSFGYSMPTARILYVESVPGVTWSMSNTMFSSNIIYSFSMNYDDDGTRWQCTEPSWYQDGECDDVNNVAACDYDGGDCCASTCGVGYSPSSYTCGESGSVLLYNSILFSFKIFFF